MESSQENYQSTAQAYAAGVRALFSPAAQAAQAERGAEAAYAPEQIITQATQLIPVSRNLTRVTTEKLEHEHAAVRAEASTQLLAKALVDFRVSEFLLQAAQDQERGLLPSAPSGPQRGAVRAISIDEQLSIILAETQADLLSIERGIDLPKDIATARVRLKQTVADVLLMIERRAGKTGQAALGGLLTMGVGQVAQAAGIVTLNIAQAVGAAEKVTQLYTLFRQFFTSAYNTLIALLGPTITKAAASQVVSWVNEVVQGEKFAVLLGKMYDTGQTQQELEKLILASPAELGAYTASLESLDALNSQYLKQIGVVEKMVTALNFVKSIPAAALPQARLLLGATYIILAGYVIFAGADYVDAPRFTRLDRIPGPARLLKSNLGKKPEPSTGPDTPPTQDNPPSQSAPTKPEKSEPTGVKKGRDQGKDPLHSKPASFGIDGGDDVPPAQPAQEGEAGSNTETAFKEEKIRLDLAVPKTPVVVGETFEIAVAIRRPRSALLSLEGLESVSSSDGTVYRRSAEDIVLYKVQVSATNCKIDIAEYTFRLRAGDDSGPFFFYLTPTQEGTIYINVTAYQDATLFLVQTRRQMKATLKSVAPDLTDPNTTRQNLLDQLEKISSQPKSPKRGSRKQYINFDIDLYGYVIDDSQQETFKVSVESSLAGDRNEKDPDLVTIPADLRQSLRLLEKRSLDSSELVALGKQIGTMLLPEKARRYFDISRYRLREDQALRIRIKTEYYPLANIAWEYAYIPPDRAQPDFTGEEGFLALDKQISITRYEVLGKPVNTLDPVEAGNLRMIMMMANPPHPNFPPLQLAQEEKNIREAIKKIPGIDLEVFADTSIQMLEDAFINSAHIFHFAGHGTFQRELGDRKDTVVGKGYLILHEENPEDCFFSANRLASTLKNCGVRLAVLGVCESGERDPENAWTGIAIALCLNGIPAVVAMQFRVYDKSALAFHRMFYRTLAEGHSIDAAVANGRQAIANANRSIEDRDWGVPVLYLRTVESGELFPKEA